MGGQGGIRDHHGWPGTLDKRRHHSFLITSKPIWYGAHSASVEDGIGMEIMIRSRIGISLLFNSRTRYSGHQHTRQGKFVIIFQGLTEHKSLPELQNCVEIVFQMLEL